MDPQMRPATPDVDPMVTAAVKNVRDRFGSEGLRDLMALAQMELRNAEQAERRLAYDESANTSSGSLDAADTQAWLAFTEAEPDR
ncbi:hypothetical protein [Haloactinopolyspora sp.]|uniref:hypothetical protein n=1 Tax=Haloactinopolyspora sp. TaxID=1966353 RepID=UPI002602FF7C|nr:hypothetical protein [Haloactinopolyspora sp.]